MQKIPIMNILRKLKLMLPIKKEKSGFTLIEVLVSLTVFVTVAFIGFNFLFSAISGSGKAEVLKDVRQNGSYALSVIDSVVRSASRLSCSKNPDSLTMWNPRGETTRFYLDDNKIASGSSSLILTSSSVEVTDFLVACSTEPGKPASVDVSFTVSKPGTDLRAGEKASQDFSTRIILRNYKY